MFELERNLTARVGGRVLEVHEPDTTEELATTARRLRDAGRSYRVLGGGSNIIAIDDPLPDPVLWTRRLHRVEYRSGNRWRVEAGVNLTRLAHQTARAGLSGLECCVGIPGTVGAAIRINAGGKFGTIQEAVREVTVLEESGRVVTREIGPGDFSYRHSTFFRELILAAELEFRPADAEACKARIKEVLQHKRSTQPLRFPSAGCIFRNPPGDSAGRLIDACGLKGLRSGGAMVSPVHANYIVNVGGATGADFLALIQEVRARVRELARVELTLEVEVWT